MRTASEGSNERESRAGLSSPFTQLICEFSELEIEHKINGFRRLYLPNLLQHWKKKFSPRVFFSSSMIWHENFVPVFRSVKKMLGEGGRGVVKVESRKWEVRIRNPIFALQKSTFDFDFLSWKLTFSSDFLVRNSTFAFWVWLFTLQIDFWFCVFDFWWPLSAAVV